MDYVAPPQRSKELRSLYDNVSFVKDKLGSLCSMYESLLAGVKHPALDAAGRGAAGSSRASTKIVKTAPDSFVSFTLSADSLQVNNFRIPLDSLQSTFRRFRDTLQSLLELYARWEPATAAAPDPGVCGRDLARDDFLSQYDAAALFDSNQLLLLLSIVNFYYDIPGLRYLQVFDCVVDDYCAIATDNDAEAAMFTRTSLPKMIIGTGSTTLSTQFHSEAFVKQLTLYLFLHVVLYGPEHFMHAFMDKYIKTLESLRKKINFDKNWEVRWVNFYVRLWNLVESPAAEPTAPLEEDASPLAAFIHVIGADQAAVVAGTAEAVAQPLPELVSKLFGECQPFFQTHGVRPTFVCLFFTQLVALNLVLCANHSGGSRCQELLETMRFNGFNHLLSEQVSASLHAGGESKLYYTLQGKFQCVRDALSYHFDGENDDWCDTLLQMAEYPTGEHHVHVEDMDVYELVAQDLAAWKKRRENRLHINKSSCRLIWDLYQVVIYRDMLCKVCDFPSLRMDCRRLLETNGLAVQFGDTRGSSAPGRAQDVADQGSADWQRAATEYRAPAVHADVVCLSKRANSDTEYYSLKRGLEDFCEDEPKPKRPNTTWFEDGCDDGDSCRYESVSSDSSGVLLSENFHLSEQTASHFKLKQVPENGGIFRDSVEAAPSGGIGKILQEVDWVKESADDVLRKIHGVLN